MRGGLYKNFIILSIIFSLVLPNFSVLAELKQPETIEEAKETGEKVFREVQGQAPGILKSIWQEEVLPIWQRMWNYAKSLWKTYVEPQLDYWWFRIRDMIELEIEKRKPIIEEEFKKEKEELKKELPGLTKSLWERFKELIK